MVADPRCGNEVTPRACAAWVLALLVASTAGAGNWSGDGGWNGGWNGRAAQADDPPDIIEAPPPDEAEEDDADDTGTAKTSSKHDEAKKADAAAAEEALLSPEDVRKLAAVWETATPERRAEIRAYYKDLGVELEQLGIGAAERKEAERANEILGALQEMALSRSPGQVLAERAKLVETRYPSPELAPGHTIAEWLIRHAVAGEWETLRKYLAEMPPASGARISAALLGKLAAIDAQLLPEEVLDVAAIVPGELTTANITALGRMLARTSRKNGTSSLMARIAAGDGKFTRREGPGREQLVRLLSSANLLREAASCLPPLSEAREAQSVLLLLTHARFRLAEAERGAEGPEAEALRREAFMLLTEVSELPRATAEEQREAIAAGVHLMPSLPRTMVTPWLQRLFTDAQRTRITAELLALEAEASTSRDAEPEQQREAVASMARAAEVLVARPDVSTAEIAVPLRLLATTLCVQMETAAGDAAEQSWWERIQHASSRAALRAALPSPAWMKALDATVAVRVTRAGISVALADNDLDVALGLLRDGVERLPGEAAALAEHTLSEWDNRLSAGQRFDYDEDYGTITATKSEQQRTLAALRELVDILAKQGVDARDLAATANTFAACFPNDTMYRRADIEAVFGALDTLPVRTACRLAEHLRASVRQYWELQTGPAAIAMAVSTGAKPKQRVPNAEAEQIIFEAYDTALALLESARARTTRSWEVEMGSASVAYDRMQLAKRLKRLEPGKELEVLATAFAAFESATAAYAEGLNRNEQLESADVFGRWFRAALGASDTSMLRVEDLPDEGSLGDGEFAKIRAALQRLPEDQAYRHTAAFAEQVLTELRKAPAEVKPRLVRAALQVVAGHPSGTPLQRLERTYNDLAKNDVQLRLRIDGEAEVQAGKPFGVRLSIRYTDPIARSTGGFDQYLSNGSYDGRNRRDNLEAEIRRAFSKGYDIRGLGWFPAALPGYAVKESGESGWFEKPLAQLYVVAKDASVDRLPQIKMQLYFTDRSGEVAVIAASDTPALRVGGERRIRPVPALQVTQTVDTRSSDDPRHPEITLEITARGAGTVPDLEDLVQGTEEAASGFALDTQSIEQRPLLFVDPKSLQDDASLQMTDLQDEMEVERLVVERTWVLRYRPGRGAGDGVFRFPNLRDDVPAKLDNRAYGATDLIPVRGGTYGFDPLLTWKQRVPLLGGVVAVITAVALGAWWWRRGSRVDSPVVHALPRRRTPLAIITTLQRWQKERAVHADAATQAELAEEIRGLERASFGPTPEEPSTAQLDAVLARWDQRLRSVNPAPAAG